MVVVVVVEIVVVEIVIMVIMVRVVIVKVKIRVITQPQTLKTLEQIQIRLLKVWKQASLLELLIQA